MIAETKQNKRARTRDQILIAAQELLVQQSAASLGIRQIAERAGLVHASFYNYYAGIDELVDGLADLVLAAHTLTVAPIRQSVTGYVALFAATTRQTLRLVKDSPPFSRLLFDSGIPFDRLLRALHGPLRADLKAGQKSGEFKIANVDLAVTMVAGGMLSLAADLHRRRAQTSAIDDMTAQFLDHLGVPPGKSRTAATAKLNFATAPAMPLSWRALGIPAPETSHAA